MNPQPMAARAEPAHRYHQAGEDASARMFLDDIQVLRRRVRECIFERPAVRNPGTLAATVVTLLNHLLATEIVSVMRYRRYHCLANGDHACGITEQFVAHFIDEERHAEQIAARIIQLGGNPDLVPDGLLSPGHAQCAADKAFIDLIKEDMLTECITMDSCRDIIDYLGDRDPATHRLLEEILAAERKHAEELAELLECLPV